LKSASLKETNSLLSRHPVESHLGNAVKADRALIFVCIAGILSVYSASCPAGVYGVSLRTLGSLGSLRPLGSLGTLGSLRGIGARHYYEASYEKAWKTIRDNYFDRDKLGEWERWHHAFDGKLTSRDDLAAAVKQMLGSLKDDYSYVLSDEARRERQSGHKSKGTVTSATLPGNIGYIRVSSLSPDNVIGEFRHNIGRLQGADGYVIDLRGNHGGFISNADGLFSMLADEGTFMTFRGRHDGSPDDEHFQLTADGWNVAENGKLTRKHRQPNLAKNKPLLILVNEDTRSAAEMLAGALRENGRAVVIGTTTFGKGVLQDSYDIGSGIEIKIVTARYFLPKGDNIHNRGIDPDIAVEQRGSNGDRQLDSALAVARRLLAERRATPPSVVAAEETQTHM
jgi:C-terminal processing protease CtpA/Prc